MVTVTLFPLLNAAQKRKYKLPELKIDFHLFEIIWKQICMINANGNTAHNTYANTDKDDQVNTNTKT